jgi:hypothetical protein
VVLFAVAQKQGAEILLARGGTISGMLTMPAIQRCLPNAASTAGKCLLNARHRCGYIKESCPHV